MSFQQLIQQLRSVKPERPLEPELKHQRKQHDAQIREEQDLRMGAVMQAVVEQGEGDGTPGPHDLVYVHVSISTDEGGVHYSTQTQHHGNGQPIAFMIEKGQRAPRAWEIAIKGMRRKQILALKVKPSYAFEHPDCAMPAPEGVPLGVPLHFELQLMNWYPSSDVRPLPLADSTFKRVLDDGSGWETPRPPFEVAFTAAAACPSYDGRQMAGTKYFSCDSEEPVVVQLGSGRLPIGVEEALGSMTAGERSVFVVPASKMAGAADAGTDAEALLLPSPPIPAEQVELELSLVSLVQVRDLVGDGAAFKKRLVAGDGEFPVDCPVEDTTVRVHYRAAQLPPGTPLQGVLTSRRGGANESDWVYDSRAHGAEFLEFDTGVGEMPFGLEMAIKLMVPGEVSLVSCAPARAYAERSDAPPGIDAGQPVLFEVTLVGFDRHSHWQNMTFEERFALADAMKAKGNELFRAKRHKHAQASYERLLRMLESTRDYQTDEHVERTDQLKLNMLSNLALTCFNQEDYIQAVTYASKALEFDPDSAKLLLRRARAQSMKGDYGAAAADLEAAAATHPPDQLAKEIEAEQLANKRREKTAGAKQRQAFRNFFDR